MNPKQDKLFNASLLALLAIYMVVTQLAGSIGMPRFDYIFAGPRPDDTSGYTVRVTALDGETMSAPTLIESELVTQLGIAYFSEAWDEVTALRSEFEQMALDDATSAEYDLIWRVINPIERYSLESNIVEKILATFKFDQTVAVYSFDL